jgi:hypothetical protein
VVVGVNDDQTWFEDTDRERRPPMPSATIVLAVPQTGPAQPAGASVPRRPTVARPDADTLIGWEAFLCWPSLDDYDDSSPDARDAECSGVDHAAKPTTFAA